MRFAIYTLADPRAHLAGRTVALSEPKSVALLAVANRALSQACKPFADKYAKAVEANADDATLAAIDTRRDESPAVIAARAEVARLEALVASDRAKQRPVMFAPVMPDGTRCGTHRWTVDADTLEAWRAETDGEKRIALLAGIKVIDGKSDIGITRSQHSLLASVYPGRDDLRAALARGELIIPQDRGDKAATTKRTKRSESEATDAALDFLFANVTAPTETETETPTGDGN